MNNEGQVQDQPVEQTISRIDRAKAQEMRVAIERLFEAEKLKMTPVVLLTIAYSSDDNDRF